MGFLSHSSLPTVVVYTVHKYKQGVSKGEFFTRINSPKEVLYSRVMVFLWRQALIMDFGSGGAKGEMYAKSVLLGRDAQIRLFKVAFSRIYENDS